MRILTEAEALNLFQCIGIDNKRHSRISWETNSLCGIKIINGGPCWDLRVCGCYDCDVTIDGRHWGGKTLTKGDKIEIL